MSRPHTFSAHCLPKKLVTAAEAGGKREPQTSFTRKKEAAGSTLPPRREEGGSGKAGYRGERWSIDALETLSYDKSAQHRDRDIALRRPARSHDLLKVRLMSPSHTCVASLWCVCVLVCLRVYEECVCVRTHIYSLNTCTAYMMSNQVVNRSFEAAGVVEGGASHALGQDQGQGHPKTLTLTKVYVAHSPPQRQKLQMEQEAEEQRQQLQATRTHAPRWHQAQTSSPPTQPRPAPRAERSDTIKEPTALFESLFAGL